LHIALKREIIRLINNSLLWFVNLKCFNKDVVMQTEIIVLI
jgi:hypothetical protein